MKAIGIFVLLALIVTAFVSTAAWARRGFFVEFNDSGQVVLYQGRPGGLLWIDPTVEATGSATRDELTDASVALVEAQPTFSSLSDATLFIRGLEMVETAQTATPTNPLTIRHRPRLTTGHHDRHARVRSRADSAHPP